MGFLTKLAYYLNRPAQSKQTQYPLPTTLENPGELPLSPLKNFSNSRAIFRLPLNLPPSLSLRNPIYISNPINKSPTIPSLANKFPLFPLKNPKNPSFHSLFLLQWPLQPRLRLLLLQSTQLPVDPSARLLKSRCRRRSPMQISLKRRNRRKQELRPKSRRNLQRR